MMTGRRSSGCSSFYLIGRLKAVGSKRSLLTTQTKASRGFSSQFWSVGEGVIGWSLTIGRSGRKGRACRRCDNTDGFYRAGLAGATRKNLVKSIPLSASRAHHAAI